MPGRRADGTLRRGSSIPGPGAAGGVGCDAARCAATPGSLADRCGRYSAVAVALGWLWVLCFGCAFPGGPPRPIQYENQAVRHLMDRVRTANAGLEAVKGLGRVTVDADGSEHRYERTAWVGADPGRLRFAFRAPTGLPVFSMSCDPEWVTALNHAEGDYYRRRIGDSSLSRFLPVAVTCADLYGLMVGRLPAVAYDTVRVDADAAGDPETIAVLLQRRLRGTVARLWIGSASGELEAVVLLDVHGNPRYEARLAERRTVDGYRLPARIHLRGPEGGLVVEAQRLWTETGVDESLFRIVPPQAP